MLTHRFNSATLSHRMTVGSTHDPRPGGDSSLDPDHSPGRSARLAEAFTHVADAVFLAEVDGRLIDANPAACEMVGYTKEELIGMRPGDLITNATPDETDRIIKGVQTGTSVITQCFYRRKSGELRAMEMRLARFHSENRDLLVASCRDLTEQKLLEERMLRIQRLSETGSTTWKVATGEIQWSDETYRIFEFDIGITITPDLVVSRIHPDDLPRFRELFSSTERDLQLDFRLVMPGGTIKYVQAAATAVSDEAGQIKEWVGAIRDISEIKRGEDALRLAIDTIPGLVWSSLPDGHIEYLNKRWLDYTGLALEEARGWGWQTAIHPDDLPRLTKYWKSIVAEGKRGEIEARLRRYDGVYRWFLFRGVPLRDGYGKLVKWYGTNTDIEAMRASEHLARGQVEALTQTLNALSRESVPEKFLEHVLRTMIGQLHAHSISVWEMNEEKGCMELIGACEGDQLHLASLEQTLASTQIPNAPRDHALWREFFETGKHCLIGEIGSEASRIRVADGSDSPWHDWLGEAVANPRILEMMQRLSSMGIVSTLCVPMFVAGKVTGFLSIRFQQKRNFHCEEIELARALAHQAMLALQLVRLTHLSRAAAVAAERNRMAREIHDTLAQGFTGIVVQLEAAEDAQSRGLTEEASEHLVRARELARDSLQEARRSVNALRPQALTNQNLCVAMAALIENTTKGTSVRAEFSVQGTPLVIPSEWEANLLRICQEALANTMRHARAQRFTARLIFDLETIRLDLSDDGIGFDPVSRHDGWGLLGMQERADAMGGTLRIHSELAKGTAITIDLRLTHGAQL